MTSVPLPAYFKKVLFLIGLNSTFNYFHCFSFPILVEGGLSNQTAVLVLSAGYLLGSMFQVHMGRILDQDRLRSAGAWVLAALFTGAVLLLLPDPRHLFLAAGVMLISISYSSLSTLIWLSMESRLPAVLQARAASIVYLVINLGGSVGAILAYFFWKTHMVWLLSIDVACTVLLLTGILRELKLASGESAARSALPRSLGEYLKLLPSLAVLLLTINLMTYFSTMSLVFTELGFEPAKITALLNAVATATVVVAGMIYYRFSDRLSQVTRLAAGCLCLTAGWVGFTFVSTQTELMFWVVIWSVGEVIVVPEISVLIYRRLAGPYVGRAAAAKTIAYRMGLVLAPLLGAFIGMFGAKNFCWLVAAMPLLALAFSAFVRPSPDQTHRV